jgi:hypothetical protein
MHNGVIVVANPDSATDRATDREDEYAALWRWTVTALLGQGCGRANAIEGANLVLEAYKANHAKQEADQPAADEMKKSGVRRCSSM